MTCIKYNNNRREDDLLRMSGGIHIQIIDY